MHLDSLYEGGTMRVVPTFKGVMEIRGDQIASRSCLVTAIKGKAKKRGQEIVSSEEEVERK